MSALLTNSGKWDLSILLCAGDLASSGAWLPLGLATEWSALLPLEGAAVHRVDTLGSVRMRAYPFCLVWKREQQGWMLCSPWNEEGGLRLQVWWGRGAEPSLGS